MFIINELNILKYESTGYGKQQIGPVLKVNEILNDKRVELTGFKTVGFLKMSFT